MQILQGMNYMQNEGFCHRDLKAENILIDEKSFTLKIADFGAATETFPEQVLTAFYGTPFYIPPEILAQSYNYKCDNWSLGVLLFVMLTGKPPFYGKGDIEIFKRIETGEYSHKVVKNLSDQF